MVKLLNTFVCNSCGAIHGKWAGRCDGCGGWNTLVEEIAEHTASRTKPRKKGRGIEFTGLQGNTAPLPRMITGICEFDRVCGGGIVPGSALLVGGDPGIGKSTLMLQAAAHLAMSGKEVVYISGEESVDQVRSRAKRLKLAKAPLQLASETSLGPIMEALKSQRPDLVVLDSMQTLWTDALAAAPGTVAQVRACAQELTRFAKKSGCAVVLIGHVTKDGQIAGPRVVEHMVDAVLYFEGDRAHQFRILRGVKNRFGPTDEIGVFEMSEQGLVEVPNPSSLFLDGCANGTTGSAVFAGMEGTRPVLTEVQALIAPSPLGTPRRAVVGWDSGRLAMVMAVLEARCGISFAGKDVYLNVAGGLKISEPAADLAVAAALLSSVFDQPLPPKTVVFGEIALSGTIRQVSRTTARLKEASKLGFKNAMIAISEDKPISDTQLDCTIAKTNNLGNLVDRFESNKN